MAMALTLAVAMAARRSTPNFKGFSNKERPLSQSRTKNRHKPQKTQTRADAWANMVPSSISPVLRFSIHRCAFRLASPLHRFSFWRSFFLHRFSFRLTLLSFIHPCVFFLHRFSFQLTLFRHRFAFGLAWSFHRFSHLSVHRCALRLTFSLHRFSFRRSFTLHRFSFRLALTLYRRFSFVVFSYIDLLSG